MDLMYYELQFIKWLQNFNMLEPIMWFFTTMGKSDYYPIIITVLLFLVNYKLAVRAGIFLTSLIGIEDILKLLFRSPRPFWVSQDIKALNTSSGFGTPSGHASSSTLWLFIARDIKKKWFFAIAIFLVFFIGLSRVYLGAHFSYQVLLGWGIGIACIFIYPLIEQKILHQCKSFSLLKKIIGAFGISLILVISGIIIQIIFGNWTLNPEHASNIIAATKDGFVDNLSVNFSGIMRAAGQLFGILAGAILLINEGGFSNNGSIKQKSIIFVLGFGLVFFFIQLSRILKLIPDFNLASIAMVEYITGFIVMFGSFYLAPKILIKLKLANKEKSNGLTIYF